MNEPEIRIWATSTDLAGTNQQRKRYFIVIEDEGNRRDMELVIGPGPALSVEPFVPRELDYTIHDFCDHEADYCVLDDEESYEYQDAAINDAFELDKSRKKTEESAPVLTQE